MSTDVIALIIALGLGIAVVVLGLRRNLSETTRNGLPQFGDASEQSTEAVGPSEGGQGRKPLSPKQARWLARSSPSQHEVIPPADWVCGPDELSGW